MILIFDILVYQIVGQSCTATATPSYLRNIRNKHFSTEPIYQSISENSKHRCKNKGIKS